MTKTGFSFGAQPRRDDGHICPIDNCRAALNKEFPMCGRHWRLVPEELRRKMFLRDPHQPGYAALEERAVIAVNEAPEKQPFR